MQVERQIWKEMYTKIFSSMKTGQGTEFNSVVISDRIGLVMKLWMESIYNAAGGGFKIYVLDSVCSKIIQNNHEVRDDDIRVLLQLYGQLFLKALELIDKEYVELITILNTDRYYFSVQGSDGFYTLYPHVNFCQCLMFRFNVSKNEKDVMCKHILACHLALALNKFKRRNTPDFVYKFS